MNLLILSFPLFLLGTVQCGGLNLWFKPEAEYFVICGSRLVASETEQHLVSHALYGDKNYQSGEKCEWTIVAPSGFYVEFKFEHIDIEWEKQCKYDMVVIYEGELAATSNHIATVCGDKTPETPIRSSHNSLLVLFKTDDTLNKKGFSATFRARPERGIIGTGSYNPNNNNIDFPIYMSPFDHEKGGGSDLDEDDSYLNVFS